MSTFTETTTRHYDAGKIALRKATPQDAETCGRICYEAFKTINEEHGFLPDFPNEESAVHVLSMMFSHPNGGFYGVVAETDGNVAGSNVLDERSAIAGVGPITVDPIAQNQGIGRTLMQAVLERAAERGFAGVRLLQAAFHNRSLSLYEKLGFDVREPMSVMNGTCRAELSAGYRVRDATDADTDACNDLCKSIHGHDRACELYDALKMRTACVVERDDHITGYTTGLGYFGHTVGEDNGDVQALILSAPEFLGPGIIVPSRNNALFRWCLENGLRVAHPMTLMTIGFYQDPAGAYLPSILY
jgi:GNAT superfamily N-acetyltransferase